MPLPPFLRLPIELHRDILDLLEIEERVRVGLINRYFASITPPPTPADFLAAETRTWAIHRAMFLCKGCACFRPLRLFADDQRKGKRGRGASEANTRLCVRCGVEAGVYTPGTEVTIMGRRYLICRTCNPFTDEAHSDTQAACNFCALSSLRKKQSSPRINDDDYHSEDDWDYSTRSYAGGRHSDELYGAWQTIRFE